MGARRYGSLLFLTLLALLPMRPVMAAEELHYGRFGTLAIYRPVAAIHSVTLFVSGDGGWNLGVIDMAKALTTLDTLVVGIDITHYMKEIAKSGERCTSAAVDFELLSHYLQKRLALPHYLPPVLVGYSSGATLVYAVLVQAPEGTFRGAISLGFCPDLLLTKPICRGSGLEADPGPKGKGFVFRPAASLRAPWFALQGDIDQVCDAGTTAAFVLHTGSARLVMLPKVGHGFSVQRNWMPQFKKAFADLSRQDRDTIPFAGQIADLPVHEVKAASPGKTMAVLYSGDGGWAGLDRQLAAALARAGVSVVGLDSLQYFWTARNPDGAAHDLQRLLDYYGKVWQIDRVILVGYSLGADVLPFMASRLSAAWRQRIVEVALLGPGPEVSFEFHLTEWLGYISDKDRYQVEPEIEKLKGFRVLCFYGRDEKDALCPRIETGIVQLQPMAGGHHFDGDYGKIAAIILQAGR